MLQNRLVFFCQRLMKNRDKTVDLHETKDLYGRLMVLPRFKGIVHQKHIIGRYEFTQTSKALSTPNYCHALKMGKFALKMDFR